MSRYMHILLILSSVIFAALKVSTCDAMPAVTTNIEIEQPGGQSFEASLCGDEWRNWTAESQTQNVILKDSDGYWKYAQISFGQLKPSSAKVGIDPAPSETIKSSEWVNALDEYSEKPVTPKTYYASGSLSNAVAPQPAGAPHKILVLLVSFTNQTIQNSDAAWYNNFFGDTGKTVKNFYKENSSGSFYFSPASESYGTANDGIIRVTLNYAHPNTDSNTDDRNRQIVKNALIAADSYINFSAFDTNGNGCIDTSELHIVTIVAGYERSCGTVTPNVWGHRWALFGAVAPPQLDGKYLCAAGYGGYTQQGETHASGGNHMATIGILCHELGHDLGLLDLYNTDTGAYAVGVSSLMDAGSWGRSASDYSGGSPAHMDPWSKIFLAFSSPTVASSGQYVLNSAAAGGYNIIGVPTSDPNQYFLVENRNVSGFDSGLYYQSIANGGIAIWHVDESIISTYESSNSINGNGHNPGIWLEVSNSTSDPYFRNGGTKDTFSDTTTPNSKLYNGSSSNVKIQVLDPTSTSMRIQLGDAATTQFSSGTYSINENAGSISMTVTRTDSSGVLTVDYATSNGTALAGSDYTASSGTLSFAAGESSKAITVPILDDSTYEGNETFTVTLSNPSSGTLASASATVTILDNEQPPAQLSISPNGLGNIGEGNYYDFTVTRTGNTNGILTVDYSTADITATAGVDYVPLSGTLTFANGEASKTIRATILWDGELEATESFNITLSNPSSGTIVNATSYITIYDLDIAFGSLSYTTGENSSYVTLTVNRGLSQSVNSSFSYTTIDGTAKAGIDYTQSSGSITFNHGETSKTILIPILNDSINESNETFSVKLTNVTYTQILTPSAIVTIIDDDAPAALLAFSPTSYTAAENSGGIALTVTRTGVTAGAVTVDYVASNGSAAAGSDYTSVSGTLSFADGETSKTITVPILDDTSYEGNESFTITLSNPSAGIITSPTATVNITEDDTAPVVSFNPTAYTIAEDGGSITVTVERTSNTAGVVSANYSTVNVSAAAGSDYTASSGTLTFADSETSKTITVNITDDSNIESSEAFKIRLSNPTGAILGSQEATVTITDNDTGAGGVPSGSITKAKPIVSSETLGSCTSGRTQQLTVIATFENGVSIDITSLAVWESTYTDVATVNAGLITGTAPGITVISFTYNGQKFSFPYTIK